ncbi:MAG: glycosyltransferase [Clostridia bacterium]|nr:glycosyltransferase [Clostridia bacterium]
MKALILTVSTGEGHNSAAKAIETALIQKGVECEKLDVYYYVNKFLGFTISYGYLLSIDAMSAGYASLYNHLEKRKPNSSKLSPTAAVFGLVASKLCDYVKNFDPDVIISTHIFAAIPVEILKSKYNVRARSIGIVTDYTVHPYWEDVKTMDHIVLPTADLGWQCEKKGLATDKQLAFGIPLREDFSKYTDKAEARRRLGLLDDKPVIMVMGGSMGFGDLCENVEQIDKVNKCFQVVVVCGANETAYKKISACKYRHKVLALGYTNEIPLIMDASDCIVTKPGGITVSEALAKNLPLILTKPIPGHEERNKSFLINSGVAMGVSEKASLQELVWLFFSDNDRRRCMTEAVKRMGHADSSEVLANFVVEIDGSVRCEQ